MKSILKGQKQKESESKYPYLGIVTDNGRVVLFSKRGAGTVVHDPKGFYEIGHYQDTWAEDTFFVKLNGVIKLSN